MLMGPEPNLRRTSRSWLVTQKPLVTVVEWGGRGEMGFCRLRVGEVGKLERGSQGLDKAADQWGDGRGKSRDPILSWTCILLAGAQTTHV